MDNQLFRDIQTDLDLNGPILSFTTQPTDTQVGGVAPGETGGPTATFTAVATVSFPGDSSPANTGTIAYQWYGPLGVLAEGTKYVGTKTTTLQITNVTSPTDVGAYYAVVDYIPSSETGNALNEPLNSDNGNLISPPLIEIIAQPTPIVTIPSTDSNFNIDASLSDNGTDIGYQWQLDGNNVSDGTITKSIVELIPGTTDKRVTKTAPTGSIDITYIPAGAKNVRIDIAGAAGGKGGGNFVNIEGPDRVGGRGGFGMSGWFDLADALHVDSNPGSGLANGITIGLYAGRKGSDGMVGSLEGAAGGQAWMPANRGGNGGRHGIGYGGQSVNGIPHSSGDAGGGGGGGGSSMVIINGTTAIVAGGGGGGGGAFNNSAGSGPNSTGTGNAGQDAGPVRTNSGAHNFTPDTMSWDRHQKLHGNSIHPSAGGGGSAGHDGQGIDTMGGGGGGAGSPGGQGGHHGHRPNGAPGGIQGQSEYSIDLVTYRSGSYNPNGDGWASLSYTVNENAVVPTNVTRTTTISGSSTNQLTLNTDGPGIGYTVRCNVNSSIASNSPVTSDDVDYRVESTLTSSIITIEGIGLTPLDPATGLPINSLANISTIDLNNGEIALDTVGNNFSGPAPTIQLYSLYAPQRDVDVEMDLYGGGASDGRDGEGGFGRIRFTMKRNEEYVIAGLTDIVNTPFLYRKGALMACVGEGGKTFKGQQRGGTTTARGLPAGDGGGIGIAGGNAQDLWFGGGKGGPLVGTANLTLNGKYGSAYPAGTGAVGTPAGILYPGDENVASGKGGVSIRCTKGVYWAQQGVSPCAQIAGSTRFRLSDGTEVTNTAPITRGYKAGYNIIQTAGRFQTGNWKSGTFRGGNGATGGDGGVGERPGGGGSGYSDGSFEIVTTTQGGSTSAAKVIIRVVT